MQKLKTTVLVVLLCLTLHFLILTTGHDLMWLFIVIIAITTSWATGVLSIEMTYGKQSKFEIEGLDEVNRLEFIDETGRLYYKHSEAKKVKVSAQIQDDGRTLKVFLQKYKEEEE